MVKYLTNPNLGTRKIIFPVVGEIEVKEGFVEIPEDKVKELLSLDFGIKLIQEGQEMSIDNGKKEEEIEISSITIESLKKDMPRVSDLKEAFESLQQFASEDEIKAFSSAKKDEMYPIILSLLNKAQEAGNEEDVEEEETE